MKGTEKIIAHIQADANAQVDAIIAQAKQQCADIREDYDARATEAYKERVRTGVKDVENHADSLNRIAQMEARKSLLAVKQSMVSECFDKAADRLVSLPQEQYLALLTRLTCEAVSEGNEQLILNDRDKAAIGPALAAAANEQLEAAGKKAELTIADTTGSFNGGLIVKRGNVEVNCTTELLIELARTDMAAEVAGVLFG